VVWLADRPIEGSADAIRRLREAGHQVVFATNNSSQPVARVEAKLADHGIEAAGAVVTSAMAAAAVIAPGSTAFVCAGPGVVEALSDRGVEVVTHGDADVVVVGLHRCFDYGRMDAAARAVRRGARLLGTNDDATYPTPDGLRPGAGAILAAVATVAAAVPEVAGKPHEPMAALIRERLGGDGGVDDAVVGRRPETDGVVVGDRVNTDGELARRLGYRFGLVMTGVTETPVDGVDLVGPDLAALVEDEL